MALGNRIPDKTLLKNVQSRLSKKCSSSPRVSGDVRSGEVTLNGTIKNEVERKQILRAVSSVEGISRVIDRIKVEVRPKTV
ncbi:BON domain-containing protein [Stieleria sp.]|uniref:BON domain protein n=1 Tax=Stieleria magnilauensis TaxID=2527963 RepID=A0ABX5XJH2_9BACT|nr:BON domain-containing protein [Phycisphaera sp. RhM]QDV81115.1 BON domain protein [Planctomycetes bacterium TBK1r]